MFTDKSTSQITPEGRFHSWQVAIGGEIEAATNLENARKNWRENWSIRRRANRNKQK